MKSALGEDYQLIGDCILVEGIKAEEIKTKSGIYVGTGLPKQHDGFEQNRPTFVRVLDVGEGHYEEKINADGSKETVDVPLYVQPGDIVLVGQLSVQWFSVFGNLISTKEHQIGLTRESEIKLRFRGADAYDRALAELAKHTETVAA